MTNPRTECRFLYAAWALIGFACGVIYACSFPTIFGCPTP